MISYSNCWKIQLKLMLRIVHMAYLEVAPDYTGKPKKATLE